MQPIAHGWDNGSNPVQASGDEHRGAHRFRTLKEGKVILSDATLIDCTIRDLSEGGARIVFDGPTNPPKSFWLLFTSTQRMRPAELLWQRGLQAGLRFTGPEQQAPPRA